MNYRLLKQEEYNLYEKLLEDSSSVYIHQSPIYLSKLSSLKNKYRIYGSFKQEKLISALPIQEKKLPFINRFIYSNPIDMVGINDSTLYEYVFNDLKKTAYKITFASSKKLELKNFNFKDTLQTIEIDLDENIDDIFSEFSKTARNCVRKAIKENVNIKIKQDEATIDLFLNMYYNMTNRKDIKAIDINFLKDLIRALLANDLGFFALASFEDTIYNIAFVASLGARARYLYGASIKSKTKTPPIGQVLQYEVIKYLQTKNFKIYDLGGISSFDLDEDSKSYSVDKFKRSFGGKTVLTSYVYTYSKNKLIEKIFK